MSKRFRVISLMEGRNLRFVFCGNAELHGVYGAIGSFKARLPSFLHLFNELPGGYGGSSRVPGKMIGMLLCLCSSMTRLKNQCYQRNVLCCCAALASGSGKPC